MLDYAEEQNINLIVVGTRGRSGIKKMLLGSIASELVTYAACRKYKCNIILTRMYNIVRIERDDDIRRILESLLNQLASRNISERNTVQNMI
jgi:K+-sensing histidine kinase KdpD